MNHVHQVIIMTVLLTFAFVFSRKLIGFGQTFHNTDFPDHIMGVTYILLLSYLGFAIHTRGEWESRASQHTL